MHAPDVQMAIVALLEPGTYERLILGYKRDLSEPFFYAFYQFSSKRKQHVKL